MDRVVEAAVSVEDSQNNSADTEEHDNTLDKIVECSSHVSADDDVNTGQDSHDDQADTVGNIKRHSEQAGEAIVDGCSVGHQENECNDTAGKLQRLGLETFAEEVGHGAGVQFLGHDTGASAEHEPCQEGADKGVSKTDPCGRETVFPSKLPCIAYEYD